MGTLNISSKALKEYKNTQPNNKIEWKKQFLKSHKIIENIINNKPWIIYKQDVFFQVNYLCDNIPSKTNRIEFRKNKNLKTILDIPQKDISVIQNNKILKTVLTYKITLEELELFVEECKFIYENYLSLTQEKFEETKVKYQDLIKRLSKVSYFSKIEPNKIDKIEGKVLVSFIPLFDDIEKFLKDEINLDINYDSIIKGAFLTFNELNKILSKVPWIIKEILNVNDLSIILPDFLNKILDEEIIKLKPPSRNNPIVGVIDSGCKLKGDFNKYIDGNYDYKEVGSLADYSHGSQVVSLIIANDELNPSSSDELGNFKVRHFEILGKSLISGQTTCSFEHLTKNMVKIISENKEIKVWNLSLGCLKTPWSLNISKLGIFIDYLSSKYNCLFIIASGNEKEECINDLESLNSPADSLNSLAVGSVSAKDGKILPTNYSSIGNILHFIKPEISSFGGPFNFDGSALKTFSNNYPIFLSEGTSFSAPRIARLAAFLIKNNYSVLEAKAKIINLANRETPMLKSSVFGHILPKTEGFEFDLKLTTSIVNKKPKYIDLSLEDVEKISVTTCNFVNPVPFLGEEYSLSNIEISLIKYDKNWFVKKYNTPESTKISINDQNGKQNFNEARYKKEKIRRIDGGKYFTSHKVSYNLLKIKEKLEEGWTYAIRIRRLDLYDLKEKIPLIVGLSVLLKGEKLSEENFIKNNEIIIESDVIVEV